MGHSTKKNKKDHVWSELAEQFQKAEKRLDSIVEDLERKSEKKLGKLEKFWKESHSRLDEAVEGFDANENPALEFIDEARVKTHLAKMELNDFMDDLEGTLSRINSKFAHLLKTATSKEIGG